MLRAARWPGEEWRADRLLVAAATEQVATIDRLADSLVPGDLLVLNDYAPTLPASLWTKDGTLEARLARRLDSDEHWDAVLLGRGSWRDPTERRGIPARAAGRILEFGGGLRAEVTAESAASPALVTLAFTVRDAEFWRLLYAQGRPVQYAYGAREFPLHVVQTPIAARPWSVEMPSAARALREEVRSGLRARGVRLATLTHACGLSSTGDTRIDAMLPLPERYEIPLETASAIADTRARGGRVVAAGTSVTRALESAARADGSVTAGPGIARLVLESEHRLRVVDALLTGMHELGESHFRLLEAFTSRARLDRIGAFAAERAFRKHEFGDFLLLFAAQK